MAHQYNIAVQTGDGAVYHKLLLPTGAILFPTESTILKAAFA
jgi:hypothetical protein